jgi:hypothetical protein
LRRKLETWTDPFFEEIFLPKWGLSAFWGPYYLLNIQGGSMPKGSSTLLLCAALALPASVSATPSAAQPSMPHWILRLADEARNAGPDINPYEAMGQLIYTAQRRGTTIDELREALTELERRVLADPGESTTQILKRGVQILIDQHGQAVPAVSANGLGYEEFKDGKVGRPASGAATAASARDH